MAEENNGVAIVGESPGDVFADEALDFDIVNGTLRIRFGVARPSQPTMPATQQLVHIGRLIMPIDSAQRMVIGLHNMLANVGLDPSGAVRAPGDPGSLN